jgi:hypothetical protein
MNLTKRVYNRSDVRQISINQAKELFTSGVFKDKGTDMFSAPILDLFIKNILQDCPTPMFGAREDEYGDVHFKSLKFRQVVDACIELANSSTLDLLRSRKLLTTMSFKYVTISDNDFYNLGITHEEIEEMLHFYL